MSEQINISYFKNDFGELILGSYYDKLCICDWRYRTKRDEIDKRIQNGLNSAYVVNESEVISNAKDELNEYFSGNRKIFDTPLLLVGTDFQKLVWNQLQKVVYGTTSNYLELTKSIGKAEAIRAVASANGSNALSIFIPCHRIIGSNGDLVGYAGGLNTKRKLLILENSINQDKLFE
jgi:methylated-DNA-[protein]-cysteine S-methyltransferase